MAKERKSPQQKKELELTKGHFTPGWDSSRAFPKTWKRKKTLVNREYRRKSDELLAPAKTGIAAEDVELIADDLTAPRFQRSITRKRLHKVGTMTVGEKVKRKMEIREETVGRRVGRRQEGEREATLALRTLGSLRDEKLVDVVRRAKMLGHCSMDERNRLYRSSDPVDQALRFLHRLNWGSASQIDALRRNPELDKALGNWMAKATRILERENRVEQRKIDQKQTTREKLRKLRKQ